MHIALTLPKNEETLIKPSAFTWPYGLAIIAPLLKLQFPSADIFYSDAEDEILKADLVCCSGLSEAWDKVNNLGHKVTELGKKFIVGGQHATALPETLKYGEVFSGPMENFASPKNLPLPDWSIFSNLQTDDGRFMLMTSRGCPYNCRFC